MSKDFEKTLKEFESEHLTNPSGLVRKIGIYFYAVRQPEIDALKSENEQLRKDADRLTYLEAHPRLGEIHVDGEVKDCYLYAISGALGVPLRAIIDAAMQEVK